MPSVSSMTKDAIAAEGSDLKDTNYRTRHSSSGTRHSALTVMSLLRILALGQGILALGQGISALTVMSLLRILALGQGILALTVMAQQWILALG